MSSVRARVDSARRCAVTYLHLRTHPYVEVDTNHAYEALGEGFMVVEGVAVEGCTHGECLLAKAVAVQGRAEFVARSARSSDVVHKQRGIPVRHTDRGARQNARAPPACQMTAGSRRLVSSSARGVVSDRHTLGACARTGGRSLLYTFDFSH